MDLRKSHASTLLLDHVARLAPRLAIGKPIDPGELTLADQPLAGRSLAERGFVALGRVVRPDVAPLRAAVDALVADGLPGVLVYAFDETWMLGEAVRRAFSTMLGTDYALAADAWAWSLPPGRGRGWTAHRGVDATVFDRTRPEVVNAWVALSDAGIERACMSFVALDDDPGYPHALVSTEVPSARAVPFPVDASTVLVWNANVLHWGGECAATAAGPRTSCSFTLVRRDFAASEPFPLVDVGVLVAARRLELIASQIVVYGDGQPDVSAEIREWAHAAHAFATLRRS